MKFSLVSKIILFSACMILNLVTLGLVMKFNGDALAERLKDVAMAQMPALHDMTLIDMYHDGIKGTIYESLAAAQANDKVKLDSTEADFLEMEKKIEETLSTVDKLPLDDDTKALVAPVRAPLKQYKVQGEQILEQLKLGKRDVALQLLPKFEESFANLEVALGHLGEKIESNAKASSDLGMQAADKAQKVGMIGLALGVLGSVVISAWLIRDLRRQLKLLLASLSHDANRLESTSGEVQTSALQLSDATAQQSAAIDETAASMEEMSSMLSQTTQQAARSLEFSEEGQTQANNGRAVMAKMASAMDDIQTANTKLDGMVRLINEIRNKTNIINDIVSETRLLSFNASIEAARAGIHGKGFAVVAEEVGKLASMSGKAASDIRELLESSTAEVSEVVNETQKRVQVGKKISEECETMFNNMKESLDKIGKSAQMISSATREQETGVKQTNIAMQDMSQATQSNMKGVERLSGQSTTLASAARSLRGSIENLQSTMLGGHQSTNAMMSAPSSHLGFHTSPSVFNNDDTISKQAHTLSEPVSDTTTIQRTDSRWRQSS